VQGLTEEDREWIKEMAKHIYSHEKIQNLGDASFRDLRKHIAISLALFAHFFFYFLQAGTEEEIARKLAGIIDFVVEQITQNQVGRVGENIDYAEEIMGFLSKVDEVRFKVELKGLSFKLVCQKIGYTPSHRVGELLKKFFWKKYRENKKTETTENKRTGTKLYFTPSCLLRRPLLNTKGDKFDSTASEVVYDKERLLGFTEEEARIWLEVFRLRHGDKWLPVLVKTFELDKLPQFQKLLGSLPEQTLLFNPEEGKDKEKTEEPKEEPEENPENPEDDVWKHF
jgi:hypothetical protein